MQRDCELVHITDIDQYLEALKDNRYSIFISSKEECTSCLKDSTIQKLKDLGLQAALKEKYGCSYLAIISEGKIVEQNGGGQLEKNGTIGNKVMPYDMVGMGNGGGISSIVFDGVEKSKNSRGLNIVVYNNEMMKVADSVCFDTFVQENSAIR